MSDQCKFQFDASNTSVLKMFEVERNKSKLQKTAGSTFEIETGTSDLGLTSVVSVIQTKMSKGYAKPSVFVDQDGGWTKIADGEAGLDYVDPETGSIDRVGVQSNLEASMAEIG